MYLIIDALMGLLNWLFPLVGWIFLAKQWIQMSVSWFISGLDNSLLMINTLRPRQNGRDFADDIIKCIFLNENV